MRIAIHDNIKTIVDLKSDFRDEIIIPSGTSGVIIEKYTDPRETDAYLAIPDETLVGGFRYENSILYPDQFEVDSVRE